MYTPESEFLLKAPSESEWLEGTYCRYSAEDLPNIERLTFDHRPVTLDVQKDGRIMSFDFLVQAFKKNWLWMSRADTLDIRWDNKFCQKIRLQAFCTYISYDSGMVVPFICTYVMMAVFDYKYRYKQVLIRAELFCHLMCSAGAAYLILLIPWYVCISDMLNP